MRSPGTRRKSASLPVARAKPCARGSRCNPEIVRSDHLTSRAQRRPDVGVDASDRLGDRERLDAREHVLDERAAPGSTRPGRTMHAVEQLADRDDADRPCLFSDQRLELLGVVGALPRDQQTCVYDDGQGSSAMPTSARIARRSSAKASSTAGAAASSSRNRAAERQRPFGGAITAVLGPALTKIPINVLQLVVGALLLVFGLQWLRKAILRASGFKALHDEDEIFARELADAKGAEHVERAGLDWYGFVLSFKGVLLEGLEVVFIVLTFGSAQGSIPLAAAGATAAFVLVVGVGIAVRAPLARVPENLMKFSVGAMLTTFGIFWSAEGAGAHWPGADAALLGLLAFVIVVSLVFVQLLKREKLEAVTA